MTKKDKEASDSNNSSNGALIVMLTDAEKRAREVIESAKKRKAIVLKKARDDSATEIDEFKKERENFLKNMHVEFANTKDNNALQFQRELESKRNELNAGYKQNVDSTLKMVLDKITNIEPKCHGNLKY